MVLVLVIFFSFRFILSLFKISLFSISSFSKLGFKFSRFINGIVLILSSANRVLEKFNKNKKK